MHSILRRYKIPGLRHDVPLDQSLLTIPGMIYAAPVRRQVVVVLDIAPAI